jgi:hypothetical protein
LFLCRWSSWFHSVHSGTTNGDVKMNFGRAERLRYKKFIVPIYGSFLQKCYCRSLHVASVNCSLTMCNLAPEDCRARALPLEEGFESLETMDLESAGADFDSVTPTSKTVDTDTSASNATVQPISRTSNPDSGGVAIIAEQPSLPHMPTSTLLSRSNTPMPSPAARSLPNTPPISPTWSLLNSPHFSPTHAHVNPSVPLSPPQPSPISPARSRLDSPAIPPTADVDELGISPPDPSISELPPVENGLGKGGRAAASRKRKSKAVHDAPSKRTRTSNINFATPSRRRTSVSASPAVVTRKSSRRENQATKRRSNEAATTTGQQPSKKPFEMAGTSAPTPTRLSLAVTPVQAEKSLPAWFSRTLVMLQSESAMGEEWMEVVTLWASFERRSKYKEVSKLGPTNRPAAVGEWIGRARLSTWRPVIGNLARYESAFWKWWSGIQPDWRLEDGKLVRERLVGDWEPL